MTGRFRASLRRALSLAGLDECQVESCLKWSVRWWGAPDGRTFGYCGRHFPEPLLFFSSRLTGPLDRGERAAWEALRS